MRKLKQYKFLYKFTILLIVFTLSGMFQLQAQCPVNPDFEISEQYCDSIVLTNLSAPIAMVDSVVWDFGDGETFTQTLPPFDTSHVYMSPGTYDIIMTSWDNTLCDDSKTIQIIIEKPIAGFYADTVCFGIATNLYDTSFTTVYPISKWHWEYDGGTTSSIANPSHTFSASGEFDIKLEVTNTIGCIDSTNHVIRVGDFPVADFTIDFGCPEDTSFFYDNSIANAESIVNWSWDIGSGLNPSMSADTFGIYSTGSYNITLEVDNNHGCSNSISKPIIVEGPDAGFWADTVCFGNETSFFDTSIFINYPIEDWVWTMDNGTVYTDQNPVHTYSFDGIDLVKLVVTNSIGCIDSTEHEVRIDSLPEANFTFGPGCVGIETCFTDKSIPNSDSISGWFWQFGDGGTSVDQNPCHIYLDADTFYVQLTVINSNGCMSTSKIDTLVVKGVPDAAFSADQTCLYDTTFFINETDTVGLQIDFWQWNFDDPSSGPDNTSSLMHPNHLFTHEGEFNVKLKTGAFGGCIDSTVTIVVVDSLPEAVFTMPDTVAMGAMVTFSDISIPHGSDIYLRIWDFGDGTGANNPNPVTHTYYEPGDYTVCLTVTDIKGCIDTLCKNITVSALPQADFWYQSDTTLLTEFFDHSFPDTITVVNWFWQFGDISAFGADTSSLQNPQYLYPAVGWYLVNFEIEDNYGGTHDTTKAVYAGKAVVSSFAHEDICYMDSILFIDQSNSPINASLEEWQWYFGDGTDTIYSEKIDSLYHTYQLPGPYTVTLITAATVNEGILTDTLYKDVYVYNPPIAYFDTSELTVCKGTPIIFSDSSYTIDPDSVTSWHWDFGDDEISDLQEYAHTYNDTGTYMVTLTVATSHNCTDTAKAHSMVAIAPDISFHMENGCVNSPAQFIPDETSIKITDWWWDFGDKYNGNDTSSLPSPAHTYTRVDLYNVKMTASSYGCEKLEQKAFIIKPIPYSDFGVTPNYQDVQGKVKFSNNSIYANHYLWDFGNGETSTVVDPTEIYEKDSTYIITLISYNSDECADTSRYELEVFFRGLYFPTAFSPNNPNDAISKFTPKGVNLRKYLVQVYDMGGNLLWESDELDENGSPTESWDGYYNGLLMPQGMYLWRAQGTFKDGSIWKGSDFQSSNPQPFGTVTLVR